MTVAILEMDSYFLHSDFAEESEKLICLSSDSAWKIILKAERVQKDHKRGRERVFKFHKSCRLVHIP